MKMIICDICFRTLDSSMLTKIPYNRYRTTSTTLPSYKPPKQLIVSSSHFSLFLSFFNLKNSENSITNKLCKFFKNLLELEREQGRYKESVAVIQKYIVMEIHPVIGNSLIPFLSLSEQGDQHR